MAYLPSLGEQLAKRARSLHTESVKKHTKTEHYELHEVSLPNGTHSTVNVQYVRPVSRSERIFRNLRNSTIGISIAALTTTAISYMRGSLDQQNEQTKPTYGGRNERWRPEQIPNKDEQRAISKRNDTVINQPQIQLVRFHFLDDNSTIPFTEINKQLNAANRWLVKQTNGISLAFNTDEDQIVDIQLPFDRLWAESNPSLVNNALRLELAESPQFDSSEKYLGFVNYYPDKDICGVDSFDIPIINLSSCFGLQSGFTHQTIVHEVLHSFGVRHSSDPHDLMYPYARPNQVLDTEMTYYFGVGQDSIDHEKYFVGPANVETQFQQEVARAREQGFPVIQIQSGTTKIGSYFYRQVDAGALISDGTRAIFLENVAAIHWLESDTALPLNSSRLLPSGGTLTEMTDGWVCTNAEMKELFVPTADDPTSKTCTNFALDR